MAHAAIPPQDHTAPCSVCGRDLPTITLAFDVGAPERGDDGAMVLPLTARPLTNMTVWRAAARLAHPRCFGGHEDVPLPLLLAA